MRGPIINIQEVSELQERGELPELIDGNMSELYPVQPPYESVSYIYRFRDVPCELSLRDGEEHISIEYKVSGVPMYSWGIRKSRDGLVVPGEENMENAYIPYGPEEPWVNPKLLLHVQDSPSLSEELRTDVFAISYLAIFATKLMHVKNVTLEEYDPNERLSRQRRRARERKERRPFLKYQILRINPFGKNTKKEPTGNKTGAVQVVHATRGHFKTFTEDRPAFGKPWGVGTFWCGPYVSGNPDFGLNWNDYHIEIESEVQS